MGNDGYIGFVSRGYFIPEDSLTICILSNQTSIPGGFIQQLYNAYLNEAPTDIHLSSTVFKGFLPMTVGTLTSEDPNNQSENSFHYSLAEADGIKDADNFCFEIINQALISKCAPDDLNKSGYSVYIKSEDGFGGEIYKAFTLPIQNTTPVEVTGVDTGIKVYPNPAFNKLYVDFG
ncbi:MAG: hypothetical protein HC906_03455 [Bacteroidales bacterium]|nr:hypothetical protein [Bacteroidales bacterium]